MASTSCIGLVKRVLDALAFRFSDAAVQVNVTPNNPARIWKLYGTKAGKGDDTPERPHRMAHLLAVPHEQTLVTPAQLTQVTEWLPAEVNTDAHEPRRGNQPGQTSFALDAWIAQHELDVDGPRDWNRGHKWVFPTCPWNPMHTNRSAYIVQFPNGAISAGCHHLGCAGKDWHALRDLVEPGWRTAGVDRPIMTKGGSLTKTTVQKRQSRRQSWPSSMDRAAFHGLAGEIVRSIAPHTEADDASLLISPLVAFGNMVGPAPHWSVSGRDHGLRLFAVLVGDTSKGRKGTAWGSIAPVLKAADPDWFKSQIASGMSSGEGLIWAVRDPIEKDEPIRERGKKTGKILEYQKLIVDSGVADKRLFVTEEEFARVLTVMNREGCTLSTTIRQAWDTGDLRVLTKNDAAKATSAHISVIGHITKTELLRNLTDTEAANGFANRFLWFFVRPSKLLPNGGSLSSAETERLGAKLAGSLAIARTIGLITRDTEANRLWAILYEHLADGDDGLLGAMTSRAEAQVMRLAAIYTALDGKTQITSDHLRAAVAVWDYVYASVAYLFGEALGDWIADTILRQLEFGGELTRTEIRDLFNRNVKAARIETALRLLENSGKAVRFVNNDTGGRPEEIWRLATNVDEHQRVDKTQGFLRIILDAENHPTGVAQESATKSVNIADDRSYDRCLNCGTSLTFQTERTFGMCGSCRVRANLDGPVGTGHQCRACKRELILVKEIEYGICMMCRADQEGEFEPIAF